MTQKGKPISALPDTTQDSVLEDMLVTVVEGSGAGSNKKIKAQEGFIAKRITTGVSGVYDMDDYGGDVSILAIPAGQDITITVENYLNTHKVLRVINMATDGSLVTIAGTYDRVVNTKSVAELFSTGSGLWVEVDALQTVGGNDFVYPNGVVYVEPNLDFLYFWIDEDKSFAFSKMFPDRLLCTGCYVEYVGGFWQVTTQSRNNVWSIEWDTGTELIYLINISGTSNGDTFILDPATVELYTKNSVRGSVTSLNNPVAIGGLMDNDFANTDPNIRQHKLVQSSVLQSSMVDFLYDVWGSGFRTDLILGSTIEEEFNATPSSISRGVTVSFLKDGTVVGLGGTSSSATQQATVQDPDGVVTDIDIALATDFPRSSINTQDENAVLLVNANANSQIMKGINGATSWSIVHVRLGITTGITRFRDGMLVATGASFGGFNPKPVYSADDGESFTDSANSIGDASIGTTVGGIHTVYMEHSDGTIFFACEGDNGGATVWARLYSAASIDGVFSEVSDVYNGVHDAERVSCSYMDPSNDAMYVGIRSTAANDLVLRRTLDAGASWSTVLTLPRAESSDILKVIKTNDGVFYAVVRGGGFYASRVIRSVDGGTSWDTIAQSSALVGDLVYVPSAASLYLIRTSTGTGADTGKGFIVETIAIEKEYATQDNSRPVKLRAYNGSLDVLIAREEVDEGDKVEFDRPVLSATPNYISLLNNSLAPIAPNLAPAGSIFRNSEDGDSLYTKELDGSLAKFGGGWVREANGDSVLRNASGVELERVTPEGNIAYNGASIPDDANDAYTQVFYSDDVVFISSKTLGTSYEANGLYLGSLGFHLTGNKNGRVLTRTTINETVRVSTETTPVKGTAVALTETKSEDSVTGSIRIKTGGTFTATL